VDFSKKWLSGFYNQELNLLNSSQSSLKSFPEKKLNRIVAGLLAVNLTFRNAHPSKISKDCQQNFTSYVRGRGEWIGMEKK
jgi:hypothetical protein